MAAGEEMCFGILWVGKVCVSAGTDQALRSDACDPPPPPSLQQLPLAASGIWKLELVGGGSGWVPWGKGDPRRQVELRGSRRPRRSLGFGDPHRQGNGGKGCWAVTGPRGNGTCCKIEKCHKEQCDVNPCNHGGTCVSIESENSTECQYKCDCLVIYEGRDCELGAERVKVAFQQGITPPKVEFAISIIFPNKEYPATQNDQTLLEEEIKDELSTVCKLGDSFAINEFKYTDSNGHLKASFKAYYNYTTNNIDEIYNGSMKKAIEEKCKSLKRNTKKVEQSVEIEQINASELNNFFKCDTTYTGYHIQTNGTAIYCISPCKSNINYCNGGNCSHTPSGPKCSCGQSSSMYQSTGDRCQISTILTDAFFKILFGTLAGILGLALLLGLIAYCIGRQSRSDFFELHTNSDRDG
uniref:mucin-4-like isoform X1 n=1 Tax=Myxine glutinosa TaxID=7769 RepID=UPI00358EDD3E